MFTRFLNVVGRAARRLAFVFTQLGGAANGGRSADPSARSLYEDREDYRPQQVPLTDRRGHEPSTWGTPQTDVKVSRTQHRVAAVTS